MVFKNKHIILSLTENHATENHLFICICFLALTNVFFSFWVYIKFFFEQIFQTGLFFKLEKHMQERRISFSLKEEISKDSSNGFFYI